MDVLECMLCDPSAKPTYLQLSLLEAIMKIFSDDCRIGSGGFAVVYKGQLRNGMVVAVKKLSEMVVIHENKFMQEVDSLMRVKHKNIVRFLGYCSDTQGEVLNIEGKNVMAENRQRLLCFEFLPNGGLDKYITDASCGLEWHERYDTIKGICFGLQYLHMECNIAHMDLKPHNIFMDANMVAKIGDFGTSRLVDPNKSMVTSNIMGTLGYMAPEYIKNGLVSKKADIFSFGVIILELLTGSKHDELAEESSMARYSVEVVEKWMKRLPNAAYSQQLSTCLLIALECVSADKDKRPCTDCIIDKLIKVESEIREKLINEGQEPWSMVEGITNVTVGVVALVFILRSWVLTIGVAVIVLLCLQNPMSSWPRVVAIECVSYDKDRRPTTDQESWSWVEGTTIVTVGVVALVLMLWSRVLTIGVAVIVLLCLQNPMSSWPRVVWLILFGIGAVLLTVLILMSPGAWPWVPLILKVPTALLQTILVKITIFLRTTLWDDKTFLLILLGKVVTAAMARAPSLMLLNRRRWSWMTSLFTIVSILAAVLVLMYTSTTWSVLLAGWMFRIMKAITLNLLAIAFVDKYVPDFLRKSRPWILFFVIEAVQETITSLLDPIISLALVFLVDY